MNDSKIFYNIFIVVMSLSTPIGVIFGLDSWIQFFKDNSDFNMSMFVLPVFLSVSIFCCIKAVKIKKSWDKTSKKN